MGNSSTLQNQGRFITKYVIWIEPGETSEDAFQMSERLLELDIFTENLGGNDVSFGVIFTARKLFQTLAPAVMGQEKEVLGVTEGTYKLDFINLTLVLFGTCGERYTTKTYTSTNSILRHLCLCNPIEAHHSSIKKVAAGHLRAAISHVLAATLPKILIHCGLRFPSEHLPPVQSMKIYIATKAICKSENHYPRHKGKTKHAIAQIQRYYFNADYYVVNDENLYGLKVTKARTTKYAKSLNGILHVEDKVEDIQLLYQSLHVTAVEHHRALFQDWGSSIWTDLELCYHVLVCIHLVCGVRLFNDAEKFTSKKTSGRPRKKKPCLTREGLSQCEYTVGALTTRLIEKPVSVINWSVLETWPTENRDGEIEDRDYMGVIEPPCMKSGARDWDVYFRKREEKVTMAVKQLSNAINYSFRVGHNILPNKKSCCLTIENSQMK
ncbi:hypothetical protein PHMEG_00026521, partial [Phytophthora megakarya]